MRAVDILILLFPHICEGKEAVLNYMVRAAGTRPLCHSNFSPTTSPALGIRVGQQLERASGAVNIAARKNLRRSKKLKYSTAYAPSMRSCRSSASEKTSAISASVMSLPSSTAF